MGTTHVLAVLAFLASPPEVTAAAPPDLLVEASMSSGGVGGGSWSLQLTPGGSLSLRVLYTSDHQGTLVAQFDLRPGQGAALRATIADEEFFQLSSSISPRAIPLHFTALHLSITLGKTKHSVELREPSQLGADPEAKRFLTVWHDLFRLVPLEPSL